MIDDDTLRGVDDGEARGSIPPHPKGAVKRTWRREEDDVDIGMGMAKIGLKLSSVLSRIAKSIVVINVIVSSSVVLYSPRTLTFQILYSTS